MTVAELLDAGIAALARGDARRLTELAAEAPGAQWVPADEGKSRERQRTLGRLLVLTRRNLRLLAPGQACGYGEQQIG